MREVDVPESSEAVNRCSIPTETVCLLIAKIREVDVKEIPADVDSGSNPIDDREIDVLEEHPEDSVRAEVTAFINAMDFDQQLDLVAMMRLGRGDGRLDDWEPLRAEAARQHNSRTAAYLLGEPLLADYLEEALTQFGRSCAGG